MSLLVPPANFGIVEEGVYRASYIDSINFLFLETLSLKSLLLLDVEKPHKHFYKFLQKNRIQLYQISNRRLKLDHHQRQESKFNAPGEEDVDVFQGNSDYDDDTDSDHSNFEKGVIYIYNDSSISSRKDDWMVIKKNLLSKIFNVVLNKNTYNIMVVDSMDVIISILRKVQKWNYSNLISEYRLYASKNKTYQVENFLDMIQIELVSNINDQQPSDSIQEDESYDPKKSGNKIPLSKPLSVTSSSSNSTEDRKNSVSSNWSADSYEYFGNSPSVHRSPRNISSARSRSMRSYQGKTNDHNDNSYKTRNSLQMVNSFKSIRSNNSYDNSYKGLLPLNDEHEASSSPQIPNNLLRIMDMRKKNKHTNDDESRQPTKSELQESNPDENAYMLDLTKKDPKEPVNLEHVSLLSAELAHLNTDSRPNYGNDGRQTTLAKHLHVFYKPLQKETYGDINNHIKITLPPNDLLPDWFQSQRDMWIEEYLALTESQE